MNFSINTSHGLINSPTYSSLREIIFLQSRELLYVKFFPFLDVGVRPLCVIKQTAPIFFVSTADHWGQTPLI